MLPSLRGEALHEAVVATIAAIHSEGFAVTHYSVLRDHLHLLVGAMSGEVLSTRMRSLTIRLALRVNRVLGRRGPVWADRWNGRALRTPREVRNAIAYVLFNGRKHGEYDYDLDPYSSACWSGAALADAACRSALEAYCEARVPPVHPARTWLLSTGWKRLGLLTNRDAARVARPR
jgi:REP element-mobilizing transposase RayT